MKLPSTVSSRLFARWHVLRAIVATFALSILAACGAGGEPSSSNAVSSNTPVATGVFAGDAKALSIVEANSIVPIYGVDNTVNELKITNRQLADEAIPGKIFILPPNEKSPSGIAIKIVRSTSTNEGSIVTYSQPAINEVFQDLEIRLRKNVTPADVIGVALPLGVKIAAVATAQTQVGIKVLPNQAEGVSLVYQPQLDRLPLDGMVSGTWVDIATGNAFQRNLNYSLGHKLGFKVTDLVLLDKDGKYLVDAGVRARNSDGKFIPVDEATTNDQLKLNGSATLDSAAVDFDIKISNRTVMRLGARMNGTINTDFKLGYQWEGKASLTDIAGELANNITIGERLKIEGIDYGTERIVLGSINVGVGGVALSGGNNITNLPLAAVISLSMGMEGSISADVSFGINYSAYFDKGMYISRKNSSAALETGEIYNIFAHGDYPNPNIAGARAATTEDIARKPFFGYGFDGGITFNNTHQIGIDVSIAIAGMIPAQLSNPLILTQISMVKGSAWNRESGWDIVGCAQNSFKADVKSSFYARIQGNVDGPWNADFNINVLDKKIELGTLSLIPETGMPLTCSVKLLPTITYSVNPSDLPPAKNNEQLVRFSGDAMWEAVNTLSKSGPAEIESWDWEFGESTLKDISNALTRTDDQYPVYSYKNAGVFTATLKVVDKYGQEVSVEKTIAIPCPQGQILKDLVCVTNDNAVVTANPSPTLLGQVVEFVLSGLQMATSVVWEFGSGVGSIITNIVNDVKNSAVITDTVTAIFNTVGEKTVVATFKDQKDGAGATLGSATVKINVIKAKIDDFNIISTGLDEAVIKVGVDTNDGVLRLPLSTANSDTTFPYIWIANSGEGTISKLNTRTGQELGRYRTGPGNGNPSRTTVDQDGSVWVGNRSNNTITKVGVKEYGQCIDRNRNGVIDTSTGGVDVRDWAGSFGDGVANAADECILLHVALSAPGVATPQDIRLIAIDKDNNLFAGGHIVASVFKVNGTTGKVLAAANTVGSVYGGFVDKEGNLWTSSITPYVGAGKIMKVKNDLTKSELVDVGFEAYGVAMDKYGSIWVTSAVSPIFGSFNPSNPTGTLRHYQQKNRGWQPCYAQGVAVDDNDGIFIAGCRDSYDHVVGHYRRVLDGNGAVDAQFVANYVVAGGPTGVAVDGVGRVWSTNEYTNNVSRITLPTATSPVVIDSYPVGYRPYNYSDMTGRTVRSITNRQGTWEAVFDGEISGNEWKKIVLAFKSELPAGTSIEVFAKAADSVIDFGAIQYVSAVTQAGTSSFDLIGNNFGRYLKVKIRLLSSDATKTPEIIGMSLQ